MSWRTVLLAPRGAMLYDAPDEAETAAMSDARQRAERYGDAVDAIYAAVERPEGWAGALAAIARCTEDRGAIFIYPREQGGMATVVTPGLEAVQAKFRSTEWSERDLRYERAVERGYLASRQCVTDRHLVSDDEVETHLYYTDLLRPHGLKWFAGLNVSPAPGVEAALSVQRGPDRPAFSDEELALVERLGRHVEAALRLSALIARSEVQPDDAGGPAERSKERPSAAAAPSAACESELAAMLAMVARGGAAS